MQDMRPAITPKSDQINYEDFLGGKTITVKITNVTIKSGEQPVTVSFEGDNGKPYKPCKSMCKVMVIVWGADANKYIGRSMTLYGDPSITWGGMAVGGIRISHMSHIDAPVTMALAATRANKKLFTVKPLVVQAEPAGDGEVKPEKENVKVSLFKALGDYCDKAGREMGDVLAEITGGKITLDTLETCPDAWAEKALKKLIGGEIGKSE